MNFSSILSQFLSHLSAITVVFAILFAGISLFLSPAAGQKKDLEFILNKALAGSSVPTGIALLLCAFSPDLLIKLDGASLNVAVAGITLLFISIKSIITTS